MNRKLEDFKTQYLGTEIPKKLESTVQGAMLKGFNRARKGKGVLKWVTAACITVTVLSFFTLVINLSPAMAEILSKIPAIGTLVRILTISEISEKNEYLDVNIKVPEVKGLTDKGAEDSMTTNWLYYLTNTKSHLE